MMMLIELKSWALHVLRKRDLFFILISVLDGPAAPSTRLPVMFLTVSKRRTQLI